MKFLKLTLKNFKPYYGKEEVPLFDKERSSDLITLNVGPNARGKTSISEAITWCLYGELRGEKREELCVNDLAKDVAMEKNDKVGMSVRLKIELEGKEYELVRSKTYEIREDQGENNNKPITMDVTERDALHVLNEEKKELDNPYAFVKKNFVPYNLMKYFNFNAEELVAEFIKNPAMTIKNSINSLLGITTLDQTIKALESTENLYKEDIRDLRSQMSQEYSQKLGKVEDDLERKEEAIKDYKENVQDYEKKMGKVESKMGDIEKTKRYRELINKKEKIENTIGELNATFLGGDESNGTISQTYLIFLQTHLEQLESRLNTRKPSTDEFKESLETLKCALEDKFKGLYLSSDRTWKLIKNSENISNSALEDVDSLDLQRTETGIPRRTISNIVYKFEDKIDNTKNTFNDLAQQLKESLENYRKVKNKIESYGKSVRDKRAVKLIDKHEKLENKVKRAKEEIKQLKNEKKSLESKKKELEEKLKIKQNKKEEWTKLRKEKETVNEVGEALKEIKEKYLKDLLAGITEKSSNILSDLVRDKRRFNSLEIHPDYSYNVRKEDGSLLYPQETSKSIRQSTVIAFFLGIAEYLEREIPFVIDNPFMRLDSPHAIRLISLLDKGEKQVILHLLPTREYTKREWEAFRDKVNTQNWIARDIKKEKSYIETKDPDMFIAWKG